MEYPVTIILAARSFNPEISSPCRILAHTMSNASSLVFSHLMFLSSSRSAVYCAAASVLTGSRDLGGLSHTGSGLSASCV
jgi:hypothetical protein